MDGRRVDAEPGDDPVTEQSHGGDHARPVDYEIPVKPASEAQPAATGRSLYVHAPRGRAGRAIDAATERFVDETRTAPAD